MSNKEDWPQLTVNLMEDVKFGGGLLGHLNKGGYFEVRQAEVGPLGDGCHCCGADKR
jgi:hypothetical protein